MHVSTPDDGAFKNSGMRHVDQVSLQHTRGGLIEEEGRGGGVVVVVWGVIKHPPSASTAAPVWRFPGSSFHQILF